MNVLFTAVMLQTYIFFHNKMIFLQNILTIVIDIKVYDDFSCRGLNRRHVGYTQILMKSWFYETDHNLSCHSVSPNLIYIFKELL